MEYLAAERPNSKRLSFQGKQSEVCDVMCQTLSFCGNNLRHSVSDFRGKVRGSLLRNAAGRLGCVDCVQSYCDCYVEIKALSNKTAPRPSPLESSAPATPTQGRQVDPHPFRNRDHHFCAKGQIGSYERRRERNSIRLLGIYRRLEESHAEYDKCRTSISE
jgi:hypothetical protein